MVDFEKYYEMMKKSCCEDDLTLTGSQGTCFIENDKIIKIYRISDSNRSDLCNYHDDRVSFPIEYITKDDKIVGEVMPYFPYQTLDKGLNLSCDLENFIKNYKAIIQVIKKYSNILMNEINYSDNILYDNNSGFYLIDTSKWIDLQRYCNKANISRFNKILFNVLISMIYEYYFNSEVVSDLNNKFKILKGSRHGEEFIRVFNCNLNEDYHIKELIELYMIIIEKFYNKKMETFEDVKNYTKILKNS